MESVKECPQCKAVVLSSANKCDVCGYSLEGKFEHFVKVTSLVFAGLGVLLLVGFIVLMVWAFRTMAKV